MEGDGPSFQRPRRPAGEVCPTAPSLREVHGSIAVPQDAGFWRKLFAFAGPGYLVAVGYMDPGNWATDLAGGARYGYTLLSVILISNLMAILLQALAVRLGIASGRDLAQACRDSYSKPVTIVLWVLCEIAIAACDLAEVIGAAIALNLLFGLPLIWGVSLTALDVLLILFLQHRGFRYVEALVVALIVAIAGSFAIEILLARPDPVRARCRIHPADRDRHQPGDALHRARHPRRDGDAAQPVSALVDRADAPLRGHAGEQDGSDPVRDARFVDCADVGALHQRGDPHRVGGGVPRHRRTRSVADIGDAHQLLSPLLGTSAAGILFAVALLCSGQNATLTGTLAGQIVMEGFVNIRLRPWLRRLITRLVAIVPAVIVVSLYGERGTGALLILSQVILSLQLPFAVFPLVSFTSNRRKMGVFVAPRLGAGAGVDDRRYHCGAERLAALPDVSRISRHVSPDPRCR